LSVWPWRDLNCYVGGGVVERMFINPNVQHLYRDWHEAAEPTATSSATSPFGGDDS